MLDIVRKRKIVSDEALEKALSLQKEKGGSLGELLVKEGVIKEGDLMGLLAEELRIPILNLSRLEPDPEIIDIISEEAARFYQVVPISKVSKVLTLAISDPFNVLTLDGLEFLTGYDLALALASKSDIKKFLDHCYTTVSSEDIRGIAEDIAGIRVEVLAAEKKDVPGAVNLLKLAEEAPVVRLTNKLLFNAVKAKASDILIEPLGNKLQIRYRIDGILVLMKSLPKSMHAAIISRLKVLSRLDISEHRLPQDGRFKIKFGRNEVDFRVSVVPSAMGEKAALRVLDKNVATLDIDKLGFGKEDMERIKKTITQPHGMVLICGPTGSGKSTTLYSFIKHIDSIEKNIITVEDPVEYQLEGINQVAVKEAVGLTFPGALRSILRQDPDIIMIGEIRDFDTVDVSIKAALTGHLVFSTLHATTASGAITRLINMGVAPFLIVASLLMAGSQRLLRKVCLDCKEPQDISEALRQELGVDKKTVFYRGRGCKRCYNTGYRGRIGVLETLFLDDEIKGLILNQASQDEINLKARQSGMKTLRENALERAVSGLTSIEEVLRITAKEAGGKLQVTSHGSQVTGHK